MKYRTRKMVMTTVDDRTVCDLCGERVSSPGYYGADEIAIEARLGEIYPGGDDLREVHEIDVCKRCFLDRVKPAIEALGCKFHVRAAHDDSGILIEDEPPGFRSADGLINPGLNDGEIAALWTYLRDLDEEGRLTPFAARALAKIKALLPLLR